MIKITETAGKKCNETFASFRKFDQDIADLEKGVLDISVCTEPGSTN